VVEEVVPGLKVVEEVVPGLKVVEELELDLFLL